MDCACNSGEPVIALIEVEPLSVGDAMGYHPPPFDDFDGLLARMKKMEETCTRYEKFMETGVLLSRMEKMEETCALYERSMETLSKQVEVVNFDDLKVELGGLKEKLEKMENSAATAQGITQEQTGVPEKLQLDLVAAGSRQSGRKSLHGQDAEEEMEEEMEEWNVYAFKTSVWDLALVIGMEDQGIMGSIFVTMLLALNALMQISLCLVINDSLTIPLIDDGTTQAMKDWRTYSGHAWDYVDKLSFEPLARRICRNDDSVPMSSSVSGTLGDIAGYLPSAEDRANESPALGHLLPVALAGMRGELMCIMALIIWITNVMVVISEAIQFSRAVWYLEKGLTKITLTSEGRELTSMGRLRKCYMAGILSLQLLVAFILAITGIFHLSYTITVGDLIMNAAALQVVLELDETFYDALAPLHARALIESFKPIARPPLRSWKGLDAWPAVSFGALCMTLALVIPTVLEPQRMHLEDARTEICGGNLDFVAVKDRMGVVWASEVSGFDDDGWVSPFKEEIPTESEGKSYQFRAVQQLVQDNSPASSNAVNGFLGSKLLASNLHKTSTHSLTGSCFGMMGAIWSLDSVSNLDVGLSSATWNSNCVDNLPKKLGCLPSNWNDKCDETFKQMIYTEILQHAMELASHGSGVRVMLGEKVMGCESVFKYCQWDSLVGVRARQICPVTCGCHDPRISIAIGGSNNGCSPACARTEKFKTVQKTRPCQDLGKNAEYWKSWKQGMGNLSLSYPESWRAAYEKIVKAVDKDHCAITAVKDPVNDWRSMCTRSYYYYIKPLVHACPVACGCNETLHEHCPLSCRV